MVELRGSLTSRGDNVVGDKIINKIEERGASNIWLAIILLGSMPQSGQKPI
jgi:hypothetical protein